MTTLGNFQNLATHYGNARKGFDEGVFVQIAMAVGGLKGKNALDIGCGTGIATRELALRGALCVGTDVSSAMLDEARKSNEGIIYIAAPTDVLPLTDGTFDLATAFSAFHWFSDDASVNEIKRILKPNGVFAVVNKNDTSGIRKDVVQFFAPYIDTPTGKEAYDPAAVLAPHFAIVDEMSFPGEELFGIEDGLEYLQSIALWNLVPESEKQHVLETIREHFIAKHRREGVLKRNIETKLVLCKNT